MSPMSGRGRLPSAGSFRLRVRVVKRCSPRLPTYEAWTDSVFVSADCRLRFHWPAYSSSRLKSAIERLRMKLAGSRDGLAMTCVTKLCGNGKLMLTELGTSAGVNDARKGSRGLAKAMS